ncbi:MAG: hypothetical protein ACTSPY_16200 [Candidatus Helarchaeota archaeon]
MAIIVWEDYRYGTDQDLFCKLITSLTESGEIPGFEFIFILIGFIVAFLISNRKKLLKILS